MAALGGGIEGQIDAWRGYLQRRAALATGDVDELEDHLRGQIDALRTAGLDEEEAFLVAVKRIGALDELSREFAREHSDRLWKQLVVPPRAGGLHARREFLVVIGLAGAAAATVQGADLLGMSPQDGDATYARNLGLFVLPWLAAYFLWKRGAPRAVALRLLAAFAVAAIIANVYPFDPSADTEVLTILHLPIALWLLVGVAYVGGRWGDHGARMDFVRFSGELAVYYALIAIGGGVLTGVSAGMFQAIGVDPGPLLGGWVVPSGAVGAVIVGSWLVEAKQSVVENMAPVLTRLFTPLFIAMLLAFLVTMLWTGERIDRNLLIVFDLLLIVVVALLLYSISAREAGQRADLFDWLNIALLVAALAVDAVALTAIAGRITDFGFTPNRVAALGENVLLLAHLAWSAVLYAGFVRGSTSFDRLERWQTRYLPVYALWALLVVAIFPPLFGFD